MAGPFSKVKKIFTSGKNDIDKQLNLDKKLVYSLSKSRIPRLAQVKYANKFLTPTERKLIRISLAVVFLSLLFLAGRFYIIHLQTIPAKGGEYSEGLVGAPKHINPLYMSLNDVDNDLGALIYSSLIKTDSQGKLENDLVESYEIAADNKTYIFKIRTDVKWHNGSEMTVDDVLFTFRTIKDAQYKSPLRASFSGVEAEKVDEETIKFVLAESYAPFLELLTFGIMPESLWDQVSPQGALISDLNLKPVGTGSYKFKSLSKDKSGQIKSYTLTINNDYYGHKPNITALSFNFFQNYDEALQALNNNVVNGLAHLSKKMEANLNARNSFYFHKLSLPELTAVFFNPKINQSLKDVKVRQALATVIDKNDIVKNVLGDNASVANGPIHSNNFAYNPDIKTYQYNKAEAAKLLDEAGWKIAEVTEADIKTIQEAEKNKKINDVDEAKLAVGAGKWLFNKDKFLIVKLTTVENDEYLQVAEKIKKAWEDLGIKMVLDVVSANEIQANVIRPRNFEALFYAQIVGNDPDVYAFWHSSQVSEFGANIANYSNKEADQLLEDARLSLNQGERVEKYKRFQEIIANELPVIFIYSPSYVYVQNKNIKGFVGERIQHPKDRFAGIANWYIKTKKRIVW